MYTVYACHGWSPVAAAAKNVLGMATISGILEAVKRSQESCAWREGKVEIGQVGHVCFAS